MADINITVEEEQAIEITVEEEQAIEITVEGGVGNGETNTASNLSDGDGAFGVFAGKELVDLTFKSLREGTGVSMSATDNEIEISANFTDFATVASTGSHTDLSNIGTLTHAQLETALSDLDTAIYQNSSTTLISGGFISKTGASTITITAGSGLIVDNTTTPGTPIKTPVTWDEFTNITPTNIGTWTATYFCIDSTGALVERDSPMPFDEIQDCVQLGWVDHFDNATIGNVSNEGMWNLDLGIQFKQFLEYLGAFNYEGNVYQPAGTDLTIARTAGVVFDGDTGRDQGLKNINTFATNLDSPVTFYYTYRDGAGDWAYIDDATEIDPEQYDDGSGTLVPVPAGKWTIKTIYYYAPTNETTITYGQAYYDTLELAVQNINAAVENPPLDFNVFRGWICVQQSTTDLSQTSQVAFINAGKFGNISAARGSAGSGETNTASNIGTEGVGVYDSKLGVDLRFKNIVSKDTGLSVTNNATNKTIELDLSVDKTYIGLGNVPNTDCTTTANITDSTDKRFTTDAEKTKLSNLSGTNSGDQNLFSTIAVSGQSNVVADSTSDTLTLVAGTNVTITTDASTDTITISASGGGGTAGFEDRTEIEVLFKNAYSTKYYEPTRDINGNIEEIGVWEDATKVVKLFTKAFTYVDGNVTQITITDEVNNNTLTKVFAYDLNGDWESTTVSYGN